MIADPLPSHHDGHRVSFEAASQAGNRVILEGHGRGRPCLFVVWAQARDPLAAGVLGWLPRRVVVLEHFGNHSVLVNLDLGHVVNGLIPPAIKPDVVRHALSV